MTSSDLRIESVHKRTQRFVTVNPFNHCFNRDSSDSQISYSLGNSTKEVEEKDLDPDVDPYRGYHRMKVTSSKITLKVHSPSSELMSGYEELIVNARISVQ